MNRRQLLKSGCGMLILANLKTASAADGAVDYTREVFEEALDGGKPFMLDFYAPW